MFARKVCVKLHPGSAVAYHREIYPQVLQALDGVIDGEPQVHTFAVSNSTIHKIPNLPR